MCVGAWRWTWCWGRSNAMTEAEWLASTDPRIIHLPHPPIPLDLMLGHLEESLGVIKTKWGRRKLRLFACACCRRYWPRLEKKTRLAIELAERFADGLATRQERWEFWQEIARLPNGRTYITDLGRSVLET